MDETNGSGSSKSDSAHRIEVVRGPRRTLIRLTGSFLVLLTPAVARTPSPPQLAYLSSPTVANRPTGRVFVRLQMLGPRIYWERLRFHQPFIFSVISSRQKDSISVCLHKRAPPVSTVGKLFIRLSVKYGSP